MGLDQFNTVLIWGMAWNDFFIFEREFAKKGRGDGGERVDE